MSVSAQLVLLAVCLVSGAFFAGMETGILSINRLRLRHLVRRRIPAALTVERLLQRPELLLGTTLVGTNLSYVMLSVYSTRLATEWFGRYGPVVASATMTLVVLVGCEYLPKAWFQSFPSRRVLRFAGLLRAASWLLYPVSWSLHEIVRRVLPVPEPVGGDPASFISREELIHLAREGAQTGMLTREESRMIRSVFSLGSRSCGDLAIPIERVVCVPPDAGAERLREIAMKHGFSRYPVRRAGGEFLGILHLRDLLCHPDASKETARSLMRPPQYAQARMPVDHVLPRMRVTGSPMMLVTDESFRVTGIITIEEVLREIVSGD